jgi:Zn-dependent alcohol dehydrogenase
MKAAVLERYETPLAVRDLVLEEPRRGEVRIRIAASGICRSDLSVSKGVLRSKRPVVLGHEAAGVVLEIGEGVTDLAVGDPVVVSLTPACGECVFCREERFNLCLQMVPGMLGSTLLDGTTRLRRGNDSVYQLCGVGSFAEEAVVCARACIRVGDALPLERACLLGCGVLTGAGAALNTPEVSEGRSVAVLGCGGVGLAAIQGARIERAGAIVAIDVDAEKLRLARELGATHAIDARSGAKQVLKAVRGATGLGVHVAIECVGSLETIELAWDLVRPGGLALVVGLPSARERVPIQVGHFSQEKRIGGSIYGSGHAHRDIERLVGLAQRGDLRLDALVSGETPLDGVQGALDDLAAGRGARQVMVNR